MWHGLPFTKMLPFLYSNWTHLITPSRKFVEVWWRSLFRSTSVGKRCTSYDSPPRPWINFEISCLRAPFSWLEKLRNHMGRDLDCMADVLMGFHRSIFSKPNTEFNSELAPMRFLGFSNHEKGALSQEILKWSTVCSTFSRSGWITFQTALVLTNWRWYPLSKISSSLNSSDITLK
jgi:hypothetical protein